MAKLTSENLDSIVSAFEQAGGVDYLTELALRDPPTFCLLLGRVMQSEIRVETPGNANPINLGTAMAAAESQMALPDRE